MARAFGDLEMKQNRNLPAEKQMVSCEPDIMVEDVVNNDLLVLVHTHYYLSTD